MQRRGAGARTARRSGRAASASCAAVAALGLVAGGCGDVRLIDPAELAVPLVGASFDVRSVEVGTGARIALRGHAYGYYGESGEVFVRFLDAGTVAVAGRPARREYTRPAEPVYVFDAALDSVPDRIEVAVGGSEAVPPCTLYLRLPAVDALADGAEVTRDADLKVPLEFAPDSLHPAHRVSVNVQLVSEAGSGGWTAVSFEREQVRSPLVIPGAILAALPPGPARLALRVEWAQPTTAYAASPCAPTLLVRAIFEAARRLQLH